MNLKNTRKILASVSAFAIMLPATGCSQINDIFIERCKDHITDYALEMANAMQDNYVDAFDNYSTEDVEFIELDELQTAAMAKYFDEFTSYFEIGKIHVTESRKKATVQVTLNDVLDLDDNTSYNASEDVMESLIESTHKRDINLVLSLKRDRDGWHFDDLGEIADSVMHPYLSLVYTGEDGFPIHFTQEYADEYAAANILDVMWYDALTGNPMTGNSTDEGRYLWCVFYFNNVQYINVTARLMKDGQEVMSQEISLHEDIVATCNFGNDPADTEFAPGTYTVQLVLRECVLSESSPLTVR